MNLSKFPNDFIIHFVGSMSVPALLGFCHHWTKWLIAALWLALWIYLEFAQRSQTWYAVMSDKCYWLRHALRDIIADVFGVVAGYLVGDYFV